MNYVVGFLFNKEKTLVALIEKQRPVWQKGRLNGIGGKVEIGERPLDAMIREFKEETGAYVDSWKHFCTLGGARDQRVDSNYDWQVDFYYTLADTETLQKLISVTDEKVTIRSAGTEFNPLPSGCLPNLNWLIPMALTMEEEHCQLFEIKEIIDYD